MAMKWEKVQMLGWSGGPGPRWGHTCNAIAGGKLLYVFGGYGKDRCQTNQVHVYSSESMHWSEPVVKGSRPVPRDSHSCTTVGDDLFVFGGTDGRRPLNDLNIFQTSTSTWVLPSVKGEAPEPREGHSAAVIGKQLFIFGGCGKYEICDIYYDDLYILDTETFFWKRVFPTGTPPSKRDSHTCSSWRNKIIVIGGEDSFNYYLSDVHILDTDTLFWCKLNTSGQLLPPRGGHTTISLGRNLFVFGGFSNEENLYDDVYVLDVETGTWIKVSVTGDGPSGRFSVAGDSLDPQLGGIIVLFGGCDKNLEPLDDMYYLHTGLYREIVIDRDERRNEKLSLRKQLKLKGKEQHTVTPDTAAYQPIPISSYMPSGSSQNIHMNVGQISSGKRTFQARVTKNFSDGYTIETIIDGKPLRGVLLSNKLTSVITDVANFHRMNIGSSNVHVDQNPNATVASQPEIIHLDTEQVAAPVQYITSDTRHPAAASSIPQEVPGSSVAPSNQPSSDAQMHEVDVSTVFNDQIFP